jgi:site-specific recombinase XerD
MTEAVESTPAVADLLARARVYVERSHAKQTLEAHAADWKHFSTWCEEHKRRSLPAAPETIICYLVETADSYRRGGDTTPAKGGRLLAAPRRPEATEDAWSQQRWRVSAL